MRFRAKPKNVIAGSAALRYLTEVASAAPREEPDWVIELEERPADPLAVYAQTYSAISDAETDTPPPGGRRRGLSVLLLAGLALAALAFALTRRSDGLLPTRPLVAEAPRVVPTPRSAYAPEVIGTTPARPKAIVRVGDARQFAVAASGPDLHYSWTVEGAPAGTGPGWSYAPRPDEVGRRRVEVVVTGREGAVRRSWTVRVKPARPPTLLAVEPAAESIELASDASVRLRLHAEAAAPLERLRTSWQVDGAPAGEGESFTFRPPRPGLTVVRASVRSDLGPTRSREWRVNVLPPPPPPPVEVARTPEPPAAPAPEAAPPRLASREVPAARTAAARAPERPGREEEVRRWLESYAAAWRAHDVEALRRMGQVSSDGETAALRAYFQTVRELDVELNVIALRTEGDRTTVRFTRRDRFRDPAGRLVLKESPTLEKQIVRTPDGLRFARPSG